MSVEQKGALDLPFQFNNDLKLEVMRALTDFFAAMGQWESECKASHRAAKNGEINLDDAQDEWTRALVQIFEKHCAAQGLPRRARGGVQFSLIPTYGPGLQEIEHVKKAKVITRALIGTKGRLVYRLTKVGDQWRIEDSRKRIDDRNREVAWDL